jgi:ubiquinone biosynthesis accessory factor UbiK
MIDLRTIDELTRKLADSLPPGLAQKKADLEAQFRTVLTGAFERMNLVGREEFEAQREVLDQARTRIAALEKRLDELQND